MQVLSSLSGITFYAPSAGFAPTNSADVSAIASAYQVVSATATQLYAGTAYLTSVNDNPLSASRAGNATNASLANSAWYDGTGRLISALPDSATVSAIASAYAESAASSKQDTLTFGYDGTSISSIDGSSLAGGGSIVFDGTSNRISSINGSSLQAQVLSSTKITIGISSDPGMFLSGSNGTAYYKANEMIINRSGYGEQVKFNLGSAGAQVYGSASGQRGAFISMFNDNHSAFLGAASGEEGMLVLDGVSAGSADIVSWSNKQDALTFGYDGSNNISSIDGSAIGGQGGGGGGVNADWTEDDPTEPSYIENKPTPKTLTAGTGISISEGVNTITISSNASVTVDQTYNASSTNAQSGTAVADAIGNLPTNLTSAQIEALKVALGIDETVLWEGTATDSCTISEAFSNFEKIRLTLDDASDHKATEVIIEPTSSTNWPVNIPYGNSIVGGIVFLHIALSGTTLSVSKAKMMSTVYSGNDAAWSNYNDESLKNALLKVVGVHRIASN